MSFELRRAWVRPPRGLCAIVLSLGLAAGLFSATRPAHAATLQVQGKSLYFNGINLAWHRFGNDFGDGQYDAAFFEQFFTDLQNYHVNSVRYWVHCGGYHAMTYNTNGYVTGLKAGYFNDFDDFWRRASSHNVMVMPCLWSFDMCKNESQIIPAGALTNLISDTNGTLSYINNALIPIVTRYANQSNLLAWEIINEPEGAMIGSSYSGLDYPVPKSDMQRFVAMIAAAIHQHCPKMVTVGANSLKYNSDRSPSVGNYWKDSALQAVYNSSDAHLDFYQIHYYDWMYSSGWDPFRLDRPVSYWNLDKPVLVGEFYGYDDTNRNRTLPQMFNNAYTNGYIGHMPWTYDSNWATSKDPLKAFGDAHAAEVDGSNTNTNPPSFPSGLLLYEGFDYPVGGLTNNNGGGLGWSDANWSCPANAPWMPTKTMVNQRPNPSILSPGLSYQGLTVAGNAVGTASGSALRAWNAASSGLFANAGNTLWFSFLFSPAGTPNNNIRVLPFANATTAQDYTMGAGVYIACAGSAATWTVCPYLETGANSATYSTSQPALSLSSSGTSLIVARFNNNGGTATNLVDTIRVWVNPNLGGIPQDTGTNSVVSSGGALDRGNWFMFRYGSTFTGTLDELRIGASYADVVAGAGPVTLSWQPSGSNLQLNWSQGTLLEATNLSGPWLTNGIPSPCTATPTGAMKFFRVLVR